MTATGNAPLTYVWRRDGQLVSSGPDSTLVLNNVTYNQRGQYSVEVSNSEGTAQSPEAMLSVLQPPFITQEPISRAVVLGSAVDFVVQVGGTAPFTYQWHHNGMAISDATNATLVISNVQAGDLGEYAVVVSNPAGSTNSMPVHLSLLPGVEQCFLTVWNSGGNYYNFPQFMRVDGQGNTHLAQTVNIANDRTEFLTLKFDTNGIVLWSALYALGTNPVNTVQGLALDMNGNVYVAGNCGDNQSSIITVVKYGPTGNQLWSASHGELTYGFERPNAIAVDASGTVYVIGTSDIGDSGQDFLTIKFNATGLEQWSRRYSFSTVSTDTGSDIKVDATGAIYVFGTSLQSTFQLTTLKYDADGNELWVRRHEAGYEAAALAMKLDSSGNVIVTGTAGDPDGTVDYATLKYNSEGTLLWHAQFGFPEGYDYPYALAVDGPGNVYVAGRSSLPDEENTSLAVFSLVKYDPNGTELWVASRMDFSSFGGVDSLAVDGAGNSYVAFSRYFPYTGTDIVTHKYDSEGNRVWAAQSSRPPLYSEEYATSVAVDPYGDILVSGIGSSELSEILLLKYKNRPAPGMPIIIQPPQSRDVRSGMPVTFAVTASGDAPLSYQWYFNGREIAGATATSYTIPSVGTAHAGHYWVNVSNAVGVAVSRTAVLSIGVPPAITRQPVGRSVLIGTEVLFDVSVLGSRPLSYQWRHNGTNIPGANASLLRLPNVQPEDSGLYSVVVTNRAGSVTSAEATLSVNRNARREWTAILNSGVAEHVRLVEMEVDSAGNAYWAGYAADNQPTRYVVAKYGSDGQQLWIRQYGTNLNGSWPAALAVDAAGNSYVTGYSYGTNNVQRFTTIKYSTDGNVEWVRELSAPIGQANDIAVGADGYIYVTGHAVGLAYGITTVKYDANGTQLWVVGYGNTGNPDVGLRVLADSSGNVYVSGLIYRTNTDVVVIKYDSGGTQLWSNGFGEPRTEHTAGLALDSQGNVIVTAYSAWSSGAIVTTKYNAGGARQWAARFEAGLYGYAQPAAIAVGSDDSIYLTGYTTAEGYGDGYYSDRDVVTLKYSPSGTLQWSAVYAGIPSTDDSGAGLALDGQGGLYVTGSTFTEQGSQGMLVLRYDTNGTRYWADVFAEGDGRVVRTAGTNCVYVGGSTFVNGYEAALIAKYTHNDVPGMPYIVTSPQSQTAIAEDDVNFSVVATGQSPLRYQWYFNGQVLPGEAGATLQIRDVERTNAGTYSVEVSNPVGLVASADAFLVVRLPGRITSGPDDQCIVAGSRAVFRITYEGEGAVGIQWYRDGVVLPNTSTTLLIPNASSTNAGVYSITVSNEFGSMTASARLIISPQATLAWANTFSATNAYYEYANAGVVDAHGNLYITGAGPAGYQTVKFGADGAIVWTRSYPGTNQHGSRATAITIGQDGAVYVTGASNGEHYEDVATVKYDADGNQLWVARYDNGSYDLANAIAVDSQGNVYVTGSTHSDSGYRDFLTIKYDANGNQLWTAQQAGAAGGDDTATAIAVDAAGNVYVTGYSTEENTIEYFWIGDYLTIKYDADGNQLWLARHGGPGGADDRATAIAVDGQGNVYVTGSHSYDYSINSGTTIYYDYDYATIKYDTNGQRLWLAVYAGSRPSPDEAADLKIDAAGNVYVTGFSEGDIVTVKYANGGQQQWVARVATGSYYNYDSSAQMALESAGNVHVTARAESDIVTFKLDANGSRTWLARYDGIGGPYGSYDYPVGLGLDPSGNVLVAGSTEGGTTGRDYLALKYLISSVAGAPVITVPPEDQYAAAGSTAVFSVTATGDAPLSYQWRRNGVTLAGETNSTLQLMMVSYADAGRYSVVVYNNIDCVVSADAMLNVGAVEVVQCAGIERMQGGAIRLIIAGPPLYHYRIETTSDFSGWQTLATVYNANGICEYTDHGAATVARRFYRIVKQH